MAFLSTMDIVQLTEREMHVLEVIVRNYIMTADPIGSQCISNMKGFNLSAATIRNVMGELEEKGFITHPHTSAGRIPTDKGYRYYVDQLVKSIELPQRIKEQIRSNIIHIEPSDLNMLMEATSKALSKATNQLGIILSPKLYRGTFRHLHMVKVGTHRYLLNVTIDSGFVKSVIVELATEVEQQTLEAACRIINDRYNGMLLQEVFRADKEMFTDIESFELGIIRLFIPSIQKMLERDNKDEVFTDGETNILLKPEFFDKEQVSSIIEILEEKNLLMHIFGCTREKADQVMVSIGGEIEKGVYSSFSVVKTAYRIGNMQGSLGVIGPKRMPYPLLISAVEYTSKVLGEL